MCIFLNGKAETARSGIGENSLDSLLKGNWKGHIEAARLIEADRGH